ncbi:MAG: hypothetical protein H6577_12330 [Lewinellaceae bacterium]|nr:hypothetical protein [Lewinellaceae bacterium]
MNIKELMNQKLNDEIERYADGIETLKERIEEKSQIIFTKIQLDAGKIFRQYTKVLCKVESIKNKKKVFIWG